MYNWIITKEFDFCYGHRVWNQVLNPEYSIDNKQVCRHLHGHQGKVAVALKTNRLVNGFVTDFKHLNWFKVFLDNNLDHKFIIDKKDPMFDVIIPHSVGGFSLSLPWKKMPEGHEIINPDYFKTLADEVLVEILEGFVAVDFVPTSENLSRWLFEIVRKKMEQINVITDSVQFFETPKTSSKCGD